MIKDITIAAAPRSSRGKNEARRLRASGSVPAVLYGGKGEPEPVAVSPKEIVRILQSKTGHNTIFNLALEGGETSPVMLVDWQNDPLKESLLHVDFKRIDLTQRVTVKVPIVTHGDPKGVKIQGGIHEIVTREIEIECLPAEIPEQFTVDVAELTIGQNIRAGEVPLGASMRLISPADAVISHVVAVRAEQPPAAEAGLAEAAAPAAEPEVVKKGKKEEGGEAAAPTPKKK